MTDEQQQKALLARAFEACLGSAAALLTVWKGSLSAQRAAELAAFEHDGERLGVAISAPGDRCTVQIFLLNPVTNETRVLEGIEQATTTSTMMN